MKTSYTLTGALLIAFFISLLIFPLNKSFFSELSKILPTEYFIFVLAIILSISICLLGIFYLVLSFNNLEIKGPILKIGIWSLILGWVGFLYQTLYFGHGWIFALMGLFIAGILAVIALIMLILSKYKK